MKLLEDYTEEELVNITDEQYQYLLQLECANRGIDLIVPEYPKEPEVVKYKGDIVFLQATFNIKKEDKLLFEEAIQNVTLWDVFKYNDDCKVNDSGLDYHEIDIYSPDYHEEVKEDKALSKRKLIEYKRKKAEYDRISKDRQGVINDINSAIYDAKDKHRYNESVKAYYNECIRLSDGNEGIAFGFLLKRFDDEEIKAAGIEKPKPAAKCKRG